MASDLQNSVVTPAEAQGISQLRQSHFPVGTESFGMPLDDACLARYLRARSGDVAKAAAMLSATLEWRREFGLPQVRAALRSLSVLPFQTAFALPDTWYQRFQYQRFQVEGGDIRCF